MQNLLDTQESITKATQKKSMAENNSQVLSNRDNSIPVTLNTAGFGDCALHASFGEWNGSMFVCRDVLHKRKQMAKKIRNCREDIALFDLVKKAIKALIMEDKDTKSKAIKDAQVAYQNYAREDNLRMQSAWDKFNQVLEKKEHSGVVEFVDNFCKQHCTKKHIVFERLTSKDKFQTCFNESRDELKKIILLIPGLAEVYKQYIDNCNIKYNWELIYTDSLIIKEYADFIEEMNNWLIPVELQIISYIFNITIDYYIKDHAKPNSKPIKIDTYNPGKFKIASICFNGRDHYEKMVNYGQLISNRELLKKQLEGNEVNPYRRDYILQELCVLEGCVAEGLRGLEDSKKTEDARIPKEPLYIVYPGEEEKAFVEGKKQLANFDTPTNPFKYDVKWLEFSIYDDQTQKSDEGSLGYIPQSAHFVNHTNPDPRLLQKFLKEILQAKTKHLLFLISIGKDNHEGNKLEATINLFKNCINGCIATIKELQVKQYESKEITKKLLENVQGDWRITVVAADTLQAYTGSLTEEQKEEATIYYRDLGKRWSDEAELVFKKLEEKITEPSLKEINVKVNIVRWEEFLECAKKKYGYETKYQYLLDIFKNPKVSKEAEMFQSAVMEKYRDHLSRELNRVDILLQEINKNKSSYSEKDIDLKPHMTKAEAKKNNDVTKAENNENKPQSSGIDKNSGSKQDIRRVVELVGFSDKKKAENVKYLERQNAIVKMLSYGLNPENLNIKTTYDNNKYNFPEIQKQFAVVRQELISKMQAYMNEASTLNKSKIVLCHGPAGIGKSHLAVFYAEYSQHSYSHYIRLDGSTKSRFESDLIRLSEKLKIYDEKISPKGLLKKISPKGLLKKIIPWLESKENCGWIMIIEDVDNYDDIKHMLPSIGGHIIINSRKQILLNEVACLLRVEVMKEAEAIELFCKYYKNNAKLELLAELVKKLCYSPLAIEMCGTFLNKYDIEIENYIRLFDNHFSDFLGDKELTENGVFNKDPVTIAYKVSINKLKAEDRLKKREVLADKLLLICAYMGTDDIPMEILDEWLHRQYPEQIKTEPTLLTRLLQQLSSCSLIAINHDRNSISISKLLQQLIRYEYSLAENSKLIKTLMEILINRFLADDWQSSHITIINKFGSHLLAILIKIQEQFKYYYKNKNIEMVDNVIKEFTTKTFIKLIFCGCFIRGSRQLESEFYFQQLGDFLHAIELADSNIMEGVFLPLIKNQLDRTFEPDALNFFNLGHQFVGLINNVATTVGDQSNNEGNLFVKQVVELNGKLEEIDSKRIEVALRIEDEDKMSMKEAEIKFEKIRPKTSKEKQSKHAAQNNQSKIGNGIDDSAAPSFFLTMSHLFTHINKFLTHVNGDSKEGSFDSPLSLNTDAQPILLTDTVESLVRIFSPAAVNDEFHKELFSATRELTQKVHNIIAELNKPGSTLEFINGNPANILMPTINRLKEGYSKLPDKQLRESGLSIANFLETVAKINNVEEWNQMISKFTNNQQTNVENNNESLAGLSKYFMNTHVKNANNNQKQRLLTKYNLNDDSQTNLEKGLCSAASRGCADDLKIFIGLVQNINGKDGNPRLNHTALHWAVIKGHKDCVQMLLANRADPSILNAAKKSPIDYATAKTSVNSDYAAIAEMLRENVRERTLNKEQSDKKSNSSNMPEFSNKFCNTSVENEKNDQIKHLLTKYKLDNASQANIEKGLRNAAVNGNSDDLKIFISLVEKINAKDIRSQAQKTALHWAVIRGFKECVKMLLDRGADIYEKDGAEKSSLDYAYEKASINSDYAAIAEMLREKILERPLNEFQTDDGQLSTNTYTSNKPI